MDATENEKLHQLNTMTLTDSPPVGEAFPVYLFTETPDNQDSVLLRSKELFRWNRNNCSKMPILLTDDLSGSNPGYPGAPVWQKRLRELNVHEDSVVLIPFTKPLLHTLSEAFTVVQFLREKGWEKLIIVAPPFHQLRCFLSMVTAVNQLNPKGLRVYNQVGITQPWGENVVHSQGTTRGKRKDLVIGELRRIEKYQKEGSPMPLVSVDTALEYLEWRDDR